MVLEEVCKVWCFENGCCTLFLVPLFPVCARKKKVTCLNKGNQMNFYVIENNVYARCF